MSLTVEKLNDDTTFLCAFAPSFAPQKHARKFPGAFTILIDPWLRGACSILHPRFQISHHTARSAIESLADLDRPPDLIIVSQDKPDHCHKDTLCTLPRDTRSRILATPAAAKKIRSWHHFHDGAVYVMKPYSSAQRDTTLTRIKIPSYTSSSADGEITIANICTKRDVTGLHNAIAITYRPPGSLLTAVDGKEIDLRNVVPLKPSPRRLRTSRSAVQIAEASHRLNTASRPRAFSSPRPNFLDPLGKRAPLSAPPDTPTEQTRIDSPNSVKIWRESQEKTLSVIYTPHGVSLSTLTSYVDNHLRHLHDALPLTCLFHSVNTEQNPWFMGGLVANGAPGGLQLVRELNARHWISAHDEMKEIRGMATTWMRSRRYSPGEVKQMLREEEAELGAKDIGTQVHLLRVGDNVRIEG